MCANTKFFNTDRINEKKAKLPQFVLSLTKTSVWKSYNYFFKTLVSSLFCAVLYACF